MFYLLGKIMQKYMNNKINPCNDFYGYACGNWKNYFTVPPDRSSYDTFEIIREHLDLVLNNILKESTKLPNTPPLLDKPNLRHLFRRNNICNDTTDATLKAKYFYESCMNEDKILERGSQSLLDILDLLGGWPLLKRNWSEHRYDLFKLLAR